VRWTPLGEADAPAVSARNPALSPVGVRRRLRERQECLLGWGGESLAYYGWDSVAPGNLPHIGRSIRPQSGDLLTLAAFTAPPFPPPSRAGIPAGSPRPGSAAEAAEGVER